MADRKIAYGSSAALTITLASLASSAALVAGRESTAVSNTTALSLDVLLTGKITVGTTPTINTSIEVWAYGSHNDTPDYPDVLDGTDSAETLMSAGIKRGALKHIVTLDVDSATSDRTYPFGPVSLASRFGGTLPKNWGVFVTQNTGVALNATGSNHAIEYTPVFETVV